MARRQTRREFLKQTSVAGSALTLSPLGIPAAEPIVLAAVPSAEEKATYADRTRWFHQARFGMFIHWGLISMARGCWGQQHERLPKAEYAKLADRFNPDKFDADAWAGLAAEAGMKYMVLTTRHHDGFCLWDSQVTDFTSVKTAAKRDFVAAYVEACRRAGLKVGLYYSLVDWRFPGYWEREKYKNSAKALVQQVHDQLRELLTQYGPIDVLWFDGHWFQDKIEWLASKPNVISAFWRSDELLKMIRKLQPQALVNDRLGVKGDFETTEQYVGASGPGRAWEACMTIADNDAWSYLSHNPSRKSTVQLLHHLVAAAREEGNFLLNVGPKPDGSIPEEEQERLRAIGQWMRVNGEAIRGSQCAPTFGTALAFWTMNGNTGYLHVFSWPGEEMTLALIASKVKSARLLATGQELSLRQEYNGRLVLSGMPAEPPDPYVSVIKVEFDGPFKALVEHDQAAWLDGSA
jgi:alpha-L-fucosidase